MINTIETTKKRGFKQIVGASMVGTVAEWYEFSSTGSQAP